MSYLNYGDTFGSTRIERAILIYRNSRIIHLGNNKYIVPSQTRSGQTYQVRYPFRCNCPDYRQRRNACKHILAAGMMIKNRRLRGATTNKRRTKYRNFMKDFL